MAQNLTIYYGTQTGNAELVAMDTSDAIAATGIEVELCGLDEVEVDDLAEIDHPFVLISSTYDDGDMPDNAEEFYEALLEADLDLSGLSYTVLGLGDSSYDDFCGAARKLDERIADLGGTQFWPRQDCDIDFEPVVKDWTARLIAHLSGDEVVAPEPAAAEDSAPVRHTRQAPYVATVAATRRLSGPGSDKAVHHVELAVDGSVFVVNPGDSVGVLVRNTAALVDEALTALGIDGATAAPAYDTDWRTALTEAVELRLPSTDLVALVRTHTPDVPADRDALDVWLYGKDVVDLVTLLPQEVRGEAIETLRPLQHREYSVASSRTVDPDRVALMVAKVEYDAGGRRHRGAGSAHVVDGLTVGDEVGVFEVPTASFRLPEADRDVVMVGPGTGLAPFRGFLHERAATGATGRNWLFLGDRRRDHDFSYRDEVEGWCTTGLITRLDTAFSRDGADKVYVQDRMRENGKELYAWLAEGATFYVCGDLASMAPAVETTLLAVAAEHGGLTADGARAWLDDLRRQRRYLKDVY